MSVKMQRIRLIGILGLMGSLMLPHPATAQDAAQNETQIGVSMPTITAPNLNPPPEVTTTTNARNTACCR
jgi:hypothetical protein